MAAIELPDPNGAAPIEELARRLSIVESQMATHADRATLKAVSADLQVQITNLRTYVDTSIRPALSVPPASPPPQPPYVPSTYVVLNDTVPAGNYSVVGFQKLLSSWFTVPKAGTIRVQATLNCYLNWWDNGTPREVYTLWESSGNESAHQTVNQSPGTYNTDNTWTIAAGSYVMDWAAILGSGNRLVVTGGSLTVTFTG